MQDKRIQYLTRLAVFVAVTLVMAYTPLGYLRTPGLEITFLMIPVTVGAIVLGPAAGAILGGVFGLTSFFQCLDGSSCTLAGTGSDTCYIGTFTEDTTIEGIDFIVV